MLRRQQELRTQTQALVDTALFSLGLYLAHSLRTHWQLEIFGGTKEIEPFVSYRWLYALIIPAVPFILRLQGFYARPLIPFRHLTIWQLLKGCVWSVIGMILVLWLIRDKTTGRSVVVLFGAISFVLVLAKEEFVRAWRNTKLAKAQLKKKLILIGSPAETARLEAELSKGEHGSGGVVAQLDINEAPVETLVRLLHEHSANGVVLAAKHTYFGQIEQTIEACEREGVPVWLLADFFKTQISRTTVDDFYGRPMLVFRSGPESSWQAMAKTVIDFVGALFAIALTGIPMLAIALMIRRESKGPILFRQRRSGLHGEPFTMLKFRSMVTDAEQRKHEIERLNEMTGPVFKVTNDPRVTPIGRFLRKWSLDELPQLINVLRGEMSLVGPRPLPVDEVRRFDDLAHRRRLSVKPGLTCLWQVSGRNNVHDFRDWVRLDLYYIDNWSLWLDLKILFRTIPVVLMGTGAK